MDRAQCQGQTGANLGLVEVQDQEEAHQVHLSACETQYTKAEEETSDVYGEENNILHILLRELNRLDDNEEKRARFWLRYRSQVGSVLTSRKTEISNGMKAVVFEGKLIVM